MKKNENKNQIKEPYSKLSPTFQRKKNYFNKTLFQDLDSNNIPLSPKKPQDELILPKKKVPNTSSHHRRTKSNSQNYIQYMTNKNINLNTYVSKLSFIFGKKELENNYNYSSVSRNKKLKENLNENKKSSNLLSISFSLKDFRNNIINAFSHKNDYVSKNNKNIINIKNNKLILNYDNATNLEETRNTTSITGFNNSNLLYNKHIKNKDNQNSKSTKYMKIIQNDKNRQLYYTKNNSSKIITFTNNVIKEKAKGKESPKYNLHRYIYKNNNIATKTNNKLNLSNNLILTKRTFKNTKKFFSKEKMNIINPISEFNDNNFDLLSIEKQGKASNKISCFSNDKITKIKKIRKEGSHKYKKRKTKSQENNNCKIGINYNNNLGEFKSVEEIHFIFVYINQKKKAFFEKKQFEKVNNNDIYNNFSLNKDIV